MCEHHEGMLQLGVCPVCNGLLHLHTTIRSLLQVSKPLLLHQTDPRQLNSRTLQAHVCIHLSGCATRCTSQAILHAPYSCCQVNSAC